MSDQAVLLPKWFSQGGIILAKGHLDHSYPFWTMANYTTVDCLCFFDSDVTIIQIWFIKQKLQNVLALSQICEMLIKYLTHILKGHDISLKNVRNRTEKSFSLINVSRSWNKIVEPKLLPKSEKNALRINIAGLCQQTFYFCSADSFSWSSFASCWIGAKTQIASK